ncbi:MAG: HEAT repeat domain-containing protein [Candidatus Hydrogenedentes bacterium]|nr:HEAT repeat domain-containing protein [Candidatus Hydrogenedentota bacterium]
MFRALMLVICLTCYAVAQLSPENSLAKMKVAEGMELTLFAAEPDLYNPTTIDIDAQGRVWVCEARNYRLFRQPITDKAGDRIRVLEDTDGDGRCDKATTFYQHPDLQAPMGIAVLGERVYVCQSPDLFYLEDTDKDGVADKRTVILTGFGGVDSDHAVHGVCFGPDGYLYFSNGDTGLDVTDKSGNRVHVGKDAPHLAASVMRSDLDGNHLELLAEGMRNPYEPAVDPWGNLFISDNDDDGNEQTRVNFVMNGANYGYWPKRKGDRRLDEVHWNTDRPGVMPTMIKTGFGSPTGLMFYQGDRAIKQYLNTLIHADAGPRVIRSYRPIQDGAGYKADLQVLVSNDEDTWFRPSDVCAAPDGSILISDWYDPGVGGHRMGDIARGRIYRLAPKGGAWKVPPFDLDSPEGFLDAVNSPNQARRYLATAAWPTAQRTNQAIRDAVGQSQFDGPRKATARDLSIDPSNCARAYWLVMHGQHDGVQEGTLMPGTSVYGDIQCEMVRRFSREGMPAMQMVLGADTVKNSDVRVRRQLLLELARFNTQPWAKTPLIDLASQYDGVDRFYRESIGIAFRGVESWAFNEVIARLGGTWDARLAGIVTQLHPPDALPLVQSALADNRLDVSLHMRALEALDAIGTPEAGQQIVSVLTTDAKPELKSHALHLLARDGGDAWRGVTEADAMRAYLKTALGDSALRDGALSFISETQLIPMLPNVVAVAVDANASPESRVKALTTVQAIGARAKRGDTVDALPQIAKLIEKADDATRSAAVKALSTFKGDDATDVLKAALINAQAEMPVRREALHALAGSRSGANTLVALAEQKAIPQELLLDATELLNSHSSEQIRLMAQKVLPRAATRDGQALPPLAELLAMPGDAARGKDVFYNPDRAQCYRCHVINGEGKNVGPDLSKIGQKASKENLFDSILNPSAAIAPEYKVWILSSFEEGTLSGFLKTDTPDVIELMDSAGVTARLDPKDILERAESTASLMPTGLSSALTAQELADVVAFLQTLK